jgi:hypothetical protein
MEEDGNPCGTTAVNRLHSQNVISRATPRGTIDCKKMTRLERFAVNSRRSGVANAGV